MAETDWQLVLGALDSLGVALAEHGHEWTVGERAIYEESIETSRRPPSKWRLRPKREKFDTK